MKKISLSLDGMGCGGCVKNVRKALDALPGVAVENVMVGSTVLAYDPERLSQQAVVEALTKAGYPVRDLGAPAGVDALVQKGDHCGLAS